MDTTYDVFIAIEKQGWLPYIGSHLRGYKMKMVLMTVFLLTSASAFANPLILKCTINQKRVSLNVQHLSGAGCHTDEIKTLNGQVKSKYKVEVCDGSEAKGTLEVEAASNQWIEVASFSAPGSCYLWREIATSTEPCRRYGHNQNCAN